MQIIPGEIIVVDGEVELNVGRPTVTIEVSNTGDRPIQVGSHYHFFETNDALRFDRAAARGFRLNIAAGTAVRFEPGQRRTVELVAYAGDRIVHGFQGRIGGPLDKPAKAKRAAKPATKTAAKPATKTAEKPAAKPPAGTKTRKTATKPAKTGARKGPKTGAKR